MTGIKVNGTFNATTIVRVSSDIPLTQGGAYKLNGCTTDTNNCRLDLTGNTSGSESYVNIDGDTAFTAGQSSFRMSIIVNSGYQASNIMLYPMIRLSTETDPTFAPYSNICPITGYTECEVDDVGVNQWDEEWRNGYYDASGSFYTDANYLATKNPIPVKGNKTYYFYCNSGNFGRIVWTDIDGNFISTDVLQNKNFARTSPNNAMYLQFDMVGTYGATYNHDISINYPSTVTTNEPYHSSNATIQFGQTVMGGKVNVTEGGTDDEVAIKTYNGSDSENWSASATYDDLYVLYDASIPKPDNLVACNEFKIVGEKPDSILNVGEITNTSNYYNIRLKTNIHNSLSDFKAFLSNNPLQICYKKATASSIATPKTDLKLLKGTNNITTNGTTITLGYQPDNVIGEVKGEIEQHLETPYLRILDNNVETPINNYRIYYHFISSAYTLVNMMEMLQHRFIFVEVIQNPSGTSNHNLLHSALIDPRTIDGFTYSIKASGNDTIWIESILDENKFNLSLRTTGGSYSDGDPTDYYVTIRFVD